MCACKYWKDASGSLSFMDLKLSKNNDWWRNVSTPATTSKTWTSNRWRNVSTPSHQRRLQMLADRQAAAVLRSSALSYRWCVCLQRLKGHPWTSAFNCGDLKLSEHSDWWRNVAHQRRLQRPAGVPIDGYIHWQICMASFIFVVFWRGSGACRGDAMEPPEPLLGQRGGEAWVSVSSLHISSIFTLMSVSMRFYAGFYDIKYYQFCWRGKKREGCSFMGCEESFIIMKLIWHSYLVLNLDNCVHKTSIEADLRIK